FAQGKVAFAVSTSVSRPFIEQAMPADKKFRVGMAPLPAGPKGAKTDLFGNNLVIFAKAPADNQRAAWLFMKWLTETDQTVAWSLASGYMPLRDSARNAPAFKAETDKDDRLPVAIHALEDAHGIPRSPDGPQVQSVMGDAMTKELHRQASGTAALTESTEKADGTRGAGARRSGRHRGARRSAGRRHAARQGGPGMERGQAGRRARRRPSRSGRAPRGRRRRLRLAGRSGDTPARSRARRRGRVG